MFYSIGSQIAEQLKCQTVPIVVPNSSFSIKLLFLLPSILIWKNCDRKSIDEKIIVRKSLFSSLIILAITGRFPDSHLHRRGREIWIFNSRHFFLVLFFCLFLFFDEFWFRHIRWKWRERRTRPPMTWSSTHPVFLVGNLWLDTGLFHQELNGAVISTHGWKPTLYKIACRSSEEHFWILGREAAGNYRSCRQDFCCWC